MSPYVVDTDSPRECVRERPAPRTLAVETELVRQAIQAVADGLCAVAELAPTHECRNTELALAGKRLRVDDQPRLALGCEHVVGVQVLVHEDLLSLGLRELVDRLEGRIQQVTLERPAGPFPAIRHVRSPPRSLVRQRSEGGSDRLPQPRQELDHDVERGVQPKVLERGAGATTLEEKRVAISIVREQAHGAVAVPHLEGMSLVLAFAVRKTDLEHGLRAVGGDRGKDQRGMRILERRAELERPPVGALTNEPRQPLEPLRPARLAREML